MNKDSKRITGEKLLESLKELNLPSEDFAVFGSGPMYPRGIKDLGHDLDIVARGTAWEKALELGTPEKPSQGDGKVIELNEGSIEIFNSWVPGYWDIDELIDSADIFDSIRYVNLENLIKWKKAMGRPKDFEHIELIEKYLENN
ncbi:MAG: hypothetical protein ABI721_04155 [Candidatus Dojkabacteria bacterium]